MTIRRHQQRIHVTRERRVGRDELLRRKKQTAEAALVRQERNELATLAEALHQESDKLRARSRDDLIRLGLIKPRN